MFVLLEWFRGMLSQKTRWRRAGAWPLLTQHQDLASIQKIGGEVKRAARHLHRRLWLT